MNPTWIRNATCRTARLLTGPTERGANARRRADRALALARCRVSVARADRLANVRHRANPRVRRRARCANARSNRGSRARGVTAPRNAASDSSSAKCNAARHSAATCPSRSARTRAPASRPITTRVKRGRAIRGPRERGVNARRDRSRVMSIACRHRAVPSPTIHRAPISGVNRQPSKIVDCCPAKPCEHR